MQHFMAFLTSNVHGSRKSRIWTMNTRRAISESAGRSMSQAAQANRSLMASPGAAPADQSPSSAWSTSRSMPGRERLAM